MDLAVTLIRSVMRAFYSTRDILVVDALILHEALRDDDLAYLMAINTKDLHKICGKLREDRFLTVRTWYYINYRHTIDAIKWRVYTIDKEVQGTSLPASEKKEYFCTHCKAEWTAMEVLDNVGPSGFLCHRCHAPLTFEADRNSGGHEQSTRLNNQFKWISELLPKIDAVHIPECDFDRALSKARPVVRDATHQRAATIAVDAGANRPMAVKGLENTGPQSIAVNISALEGPSEAEKQAERARKDKIAQQNALPAWMSTSTVTGESFSTTPGLNATTVWKHEPDDKNKGEGVDSNASAQIDGIFERLKAEQAAERAREAAGDDGDEEDEDGEEESGSDEEGEFEDVPAHAKNAGLEAPVESKTKRQFSDATAVEERAAKRVKVEEKGDKVGDDANDDDDEELEFEDV
ncbi:hypothetical protein CDD82_1041 [Ophiocordyceps australis]|uniref:HTH TFE/IIEalpha-type domain-containing protein n=1 Tax=Ophiocordyceps australis TaxID=1399860 RepID=A0A2C5YK52_9HYPO|nr:hypothetical protein CDD82_1041 [Ophiocordyceps australis]